MSSWPPIELLPWSSMLERCLADDEHAWMEMVDALGPPLIGLFARMGNDPETARDLVQQLFLKLLDEDRRLLRQFDEDRGVPFPLYIRVIAIHLGIDWGRTRQAKDRQRWVPIDEITKMAGGEDPAEALIAREAVEAFQELGDRDRVVLELRAIGATYEEIARIVGMTIGGVSATMSRARQRLRRVLDEGSADVGYSR